MRAARPRRVMHHGHAPHQPGLAVGLRQRALEPFSLRAALPVVHPVQKEEAHAAPARRAVGLRRAAGVGVAEVAGEVRPRLIVVELVIADAQEERAIAEERLLDAKERRPVRRAPPVGHQVAGVHQEIRRHGHHRLHQRRVDGVVAAIVAIEKKPHRLPRVALGGGDEVPLSEHRPADDDRVVVRPRRLQSRHAHHMHRRRRVSRHPLRSAAVAGPYRHLHARRRRGIELEAHVDPDVGETGEVRALQERRGRRRSGPGRPRAEREGDRGRACHRQARSSGAPHVRAASYPGGEGSANASEAAARRQRVRCTGRPSAMARRSRGLRAT